jgi:hypothetical protein
VSAAVVLAGTAPLVSTESAFRAWVDRLVVAAAPRCPTFEALVLALPGVLPDEALASLRRHPGGACDRLALDASTDRCGSVVDQVADLPLPHPLDSEYRFDAPTADALAAALVDATRPGDEILLVGTPSVALSLARAGVDRRLRFVGSDDCVTAALAEACGDALVIGAGIERSAAAAVVDPPWYQAPVAAMTAIAAARARPGAPVWLVVPTAGARPGADVDRAAFLQTAGGLGLGSPGRGLAVRYRSPLFELAVLACQGVGRLSAWRTGEAVLLVAGDAAAAPTAVARPPRPCELTVRGVRLRVVAGDAGGETLTPLVEGEVFPSVSSRAPGREGATLWTSGNRAFRVDPALARAALAGLWAASGHLWPEGLRSMGNDRSAFSGVARAEGLIQDLAGLIEREVSEARRLVGDGAWRETAMDWRF